MSRMSIDALEMLNPFQLGELLHYEITRASPDVQHIQNLLDVGCLINTRDKWGQTALHWAAWYGHLEIVKFLISRGADIHVGCNIGRTPLHNSATMRQLEVVKFLISKGADKNTKDEDERRAWDYANEETRIAIPELRP